MSPPKTLNARVPWSWLLDQLEIVVPSPALPAVLLRCPLCKHEQLTIMDDYLAGGQWFYCQNCKKTGDMIELAAKAWGLSIEGTIIKLTRRGFDLPADSDTVRGYLTGHVEYRKRLRRLWRQAQPYIYHHGTTLRSLLCKLGLPNEFSVEQWNAGPAKILGGKLCQTIEEAILPESVVCCGAEQVPRCRSTRRIFKGGMWKEALMLPFYAAPGRICAFGFIGRQGDMTKDYVFRTVNVTPFINQPHREAGLAMHSDVREIAADWQHTVFAVSDPMAYLRIQLRQFEYSNNPLPLVLWQDWPGKTHVRTQHAWRMFHNSRVVFWDPSMSFATLRQAIEVNGWIATCGPRRNEEEKLREYLWRSTPTMLCRHLQKHARPWPRALAKAMPKWTDAYIENLFVQLQLDATQIEKVRKACPRELRQRLDSILKSQQIQRFVHFDNRIVVERDDGWYCRRNRDLERQEELVCDAKLRLSQIVTYKRTGRAVYSGTIIFNGGEIPFTAPQKEIENGPLGWMRQFLLQRGKGLLRYNPSWNKSLLSVAASFHDPKVVQGIETVGWSHEKAAFLLPGRIIGLDGTRKMPLTKDVAAFPAAGLRYSTKPLPANWHELADDYTLALFWGGLAGVLSNMLAPALFTETKGIGLVGEGAQTVGMAVAKAAGCLTREIRAVPSVRKAAEEEQRHRWPLCVPVASNATSAAMTKWLEEDQSYSRNCITPLDEETAERKRVEGGWHLLRGLEPATANASLLGLVRRIVPQYLRDVCERRLQVEDVHEDLASFIARQGGTIHLDQVRNVLRVTTGQPDTETHGENAAVGSAGGRTRSTHTD